MISRQLKDVHFAKVIFFHPVVGLTFCLLILAVAYLFYDFQMGIHSASIYATLLLTCVFDFICLNAHNIAFQSDSTGFISIFGYLVVLYGFLADEFIFGTSLTGFDLLGGVLIFGVTVAVTV